MANSLAVHYKQGHGAAPLIVESADEVDVLVDTLLDESQEYAVAAIYLRERPTIMGGYPDHDFRLGVDQDRKVGVLRFADMSDGGYDDAYAVGHAVSGDVVVYEQMGNPMEFPPDTELPLDAIRAAVNEFLQTGTRPSSVTWKSWPEDLL